MAIAVHLRVFLWSTQLNVGIDAQCPAYRMPRLYARYCKRHVVLRMCIHAQEHIVVFADMAGHRTHGLWILNSLAPCFLLPSYEPNELLGRVVMVQRRNDIALRACYGQAWAYGHKAAERAFEPRR